MVLFIGDLHIGRGSRQVSRGVERDAVDLLEAHRRALLRPGGAVVLLGDVFDAFMEFDALIPAQGVRLAGALAGLADRGVHIYYITGNRDPWHLHFFEEEIGARLVHGALRFEAFGRGIIAAHGDGYSPSEWSYRLLRPMLRSRIAYWMYRHSFPGDTGYRFARWVAGRGTGMPNPTVAGELRAAARELLARQDVDLVVFGHSHAAEETLLEGGTYINAGYWFADRTYAALDEAGPRLRTWHGGSE
jgi:UDP-2,3-diacylglucosamine hydrolase